eukprot:TRINITY_DN23465_c0_g1_i1.p1 TRINITY_DN23465_c0_g1~~TRINITY_DN23465_c0_g1_i1.p1  ORF type:complete len:106 (-),score=16.92 TRINITY_DN23465_c0_g1_i1:135-452(-)
MKISDRGILPDSTTPPGVRVYLKISPSRLLYALPEEKPDHPFIIPYWAIESPKEFQAGKGFLSLKCTNFCPSFLSFAFPNPPGLAFSSLPSFFLPSPPFLPSSLP